MLGEVFDRCRTDKGPWGHLYDRAYERLLPPRDAPIRLLEIGIAAGASLRAWEEWFPNAEIMAIDINPETQRHESERSRVFVGDAADKDFMADVIADTGGGWNVVIDDGSHEYRHIMGSFEILWREVVPGGMYVVEDLHLTEHRRRQKAADAFFQMVRNNILWPRLTRKRMGYAPMFCFCGEALFILKP